MLPTLRPAQRRRPLRAVIALAALTFLTLPVAAWANHSDGSAQSFTFLQAGFTQDLYGVMPHFAGGVAFAPDGDPLVDFCSFSGSPLSRFDSQGTVSEPANHQSELHPRTQVPSNAGCGLTNHPNGFLYTNTSSGVVQLNADTGAQTAGPGGPGGNALGIAPDPQTGNLIYVGSDSTLHSINPALTSTSVFSTVTTGNFVDGIAWDPTGNFLFAANRSPGFRLTILRRDGTLVQHIAMTSEPDGISFHATTPKFVITVNTDGTITRFDFPGDDYSQPPVQSIFASGGFRGDLSQVGPDGCVYLTQAGTRYDDGTTSGDNSLVRICGGFAPPPGVGDTTKPSCVISSKTAAGITVTVQDTGSGLGSIVVTKNVNATVTWPPFTVGTTSAVVVTAAKNNLALSSSVALRVTDVDGNITLCDPVLTTTIRENGSPATETHSGLPQAESKVWIQNGTPGVNRLDITVNGKTWKLTGLKAGQEISLDVASAMVAGDNNTISVTAHGKPGGSALVVISD